LPKFMRPSGRRNRESMANERHAIQIVDTLKLLQDLLNTGLMAANPKNRKGVGWR
jgi:hypothetical protein